MHIHRETPEGWEKQESALSGVEIVRRGGGRQKCFLHAAFPEAGLYKLVLFFNSFGQDTIYVDSLKGSTEVRPTAKAEGDHGFIPLIPRSACVTAPNGLLRIAFAAFSQHTHFEAKVKTHPDKPLKGSFTIDKSRLTIPCDASRSLTDFRIIFTENDVCTVQIWVGVSGNRIARFVEYQVTITGITPGGTAPAGQMDPIDMDEVNCVVDQALDQDEFDDLRDFYRTNLGPVADCLPPRLATVRTCTTP
jgi:hypothetical protein